MARATPHRPDCPCRPCIGRRRRPGLPEPGDSRVQGDDLLAKRVLALQRVVYKGQRAIDRAHRLLAQVMPAQRASRARSTWLASATHTAWEWALGWRRGESPSSPPACWSMGARVATPG